MKTLFKSVLINDAVQITVSSGYAHSPEQEYLFIDYTDHRMHQQ